MTAAVATVNILTGLAYLAIGTLIVIEIARSWRTLGFSQFGFGVVLLAYTCGPHHLHHGWHVALTGDAAALDLVTVGVGLVPGAAFALLRAEAVFGGRGERFVGGTPRWLQVMPTMAAVYVTALVAAGIGQSGAGLSADRVIPPNLLLAALYAVIGVLLLRTQVLSRPEFGGWSASGLSLAGLFLTCSLMHAAHALGFATDIYTSDVHHYVIAWVGVPAGIYFLAVVWALRTGIGTDWNRAPLIPERDTISGTKEAG